MRILITGSTGLLGQALVARLAPEAEVVGASRRRVPPATGSTHAVCDLTEAPAVEALIRRVRPELVVHAQAQADVDACERDPGMAQRMNVDTTAHLVAALRDADAWLVGISTDYVFDGRKTVPYDEDDAPAPLSVYGRSKVAAERLVRSRPRGIVVRVSTLFGPGRSNFCTRVIERGAAGEPIEAYADQTTSPSYTVDVADGIAALVAALRRQPGQAREQVYHVANAGGCRRVEFVQRVMNELGYPESLIRPIRMKDQRRTAPRPAYSVLGCGRLSRMTGRTLRPWHEALQAFLRQRR